MTFSRVILVHAAPERVFSVLADLNQSRQWMPAIQEISEITQGAFQANTAWTESRKAGKRLMTSRVRVSSFEPPTRLALEVDNKVMRGRMAFTLAQGKDGTEVRYEAQMFGKGLFRLMSSKMNKMMAAEDDDILERLRAQVESRP